MAKHVTPPHERVLARIVVDEAGCWLFPGFRWDGYAVISGPNRTKVLGHRVVYEALVGPIPDGLVLDHLCRVRNCVNPEHLEPVTRGENARRGELPGAPQQAFCKNGHDMAVTRRNVTSNGKRQSFCGECAREAQRRRRAARK